MSDDLPERESFFKSNRFFFKRAKISEIKNPAVEKNVSPLIAHEMMQIMQDLFFSKIQDREFVNMICDARRMALVRCLQKARDGLKNGDDQRRALLNAMLRWTNKESCHLWPLYKVARWSRPDLVDSLNHAALDGNGNRVINTVMHDQKIRSGEENAVSRPVSKTAKTVIDPFEQEEKILFSLDAPVQPESDPFKTGGKTGATLKELKNLRSGKKSKPKVQHVAEERTASSDQTRLINLEWYGNAFGDRVDHLLPESITQRPWRSRDDYMKELSESDRHLLSEENRDAWIAACGPCMDQLDTFLICPLNTFMNMTIQLSVRPCRDQIARYRVPPAVLPRAWYRASMWKKYVKCIEKTMPLAEKKVIRPP